MTMSNEREQELALQQVDELDRQIPDSVPAETSPVLSDGEDPLGAAKGCLTAVAIMVVVAVVVGLSIWLGVKFYN